MREYEKGGKKERRNCIINGVKRMIIFLLEKKLLIGGVGIRSKYKMYKIYTPELSFFIPTISMHVCYINIWAFPSYVDIPFLSQPHKYD